MLHKCSVLILFVCAVHSAKILSVFSVPSYSHFQVGDQICKQLASRGHEVTFITPFEQKKPVKNLKHVVVNGSLEIFGDLVPQFLTWRQDSIFTRTINLEEMGYFVTEYTLKHRNVQKLLRSNVTFDVVIVDLFLNEALYGFSYYYKAPRVVVSVMGASQWTDSKMGKPHNPSYIPELFQGYSSNLNFFQRIVNTLVYAGTELYTHFHTLPMQDQLLQKYFPGSPDLRELRYNNSLMLLNSHVSINNPLPFVPNVVEVGGCHITPPTQLPQNLKQYLDNAKDGFIYLSLGSILPLNTFSEQIQEDFLKVFSKLKQKVLWKVGNDSVLNLPPNVRLEKWLSQQSVLAHPNIRLFITHGGWSSSMEAVYYGVPILGIPILGDQETNIANAVSKGLGIELSLEQLSEKNVDAAIKEVLDNPKYSENAKMRSKIMHDQPEQPIDRAIYWLEYVMRHQGAPHLQTAALRLSWYQYLLLDVLLVLALNALVIVWSLYQLTKPIFKKK